MPLLSDLSHDGIVGFAGGLRSWRVRREEAHFRREGEGEEEGGEPYNGRRRRRRRRRRVGGERTAETGRAASSRRGCSRCRPSFITRLPGARARARACVCGCVIQGDGAEEIFSLEPAAAAWCISCLVVAVVIVVLVDTPATAARGEEGRVAAADIQTEFWGLLGGRRQWGRERGSQRRRPRRRSC